MWLSLVQGAFLAEHHNGGLQLEGLPSTPSLQPLIVQLPVGAWISRSDGGGSRFPITGRRSRTAGSVVESRPSPSLAQEASRCHGQGGVSPRVHRRGHHSHRAARLRGALATEAHPVPVGMSGAASSSRRRSSSQAAGGTPGPKSGGDAGQVAGSGGEKPAAERLAPQPEEIITQIDSIQILENWELPLMSRDMTITRAEEHTDACHTRPALRPASPLDALQRGLRGY